jgi:hypothetical protein
MLSKLAILNCRLEDDAQGICISNSKVSNLSIGAFYPLSNTYKVILCTPKLTSLTISKICSTFPAPSTCNLTLLEELKFDCMHEISKSIMGEDIFIGWLHLIAKVKMMTLSFTFLKLMVDVSYFSIFTPLSSYFLGLNALLTPQVSQLCDFGPPNFNCAILVPHFYPLLHLEVPHFDFDLFLNKKY